MLTNMYVNVKFYEALSFVPSPPIMLIMVINYTIKPFQSACIITFSESAHKHAHQLPMLLNWSNLNAGFFCMSVLCAGEKKKAEPVCITAFAVQRPFISIYCVCTATCQAVLGQKGCLLPAALESAWASIQPTQQPVQCCLALQTGMGGEVWGVASFVMLPLSLSLSRFPLFIHAVTSTYPLSLQHAQHNGKERQRRKKKWNRHLLQAFTKIVQRKKIKTRPSKRLKRIWGLE